MMMLLLFRVPHFERHCPRMTLKGCTVIFLPNFGLWIIFPRAHGAGAGLRVHASVAADSLESVLVQPLTGWEQCPAGSGRDCSRCPIDGMTRCTLCGSELEAQKEVLEEEGKDGKVS